MKMFTTLVGIAGLALSSVAMAQDSAEPLKGPPVRDNSVPGTKRSFGSGAGKTGKDRLDPIGTPMPVFMKAIDTLRGDAGGDNKISDEQDSQIKTMRSEFEASVKTYATQHQDEIKSLISKISPEDRAKFNQVIGREGGRLGLAKRGFRSPGKNEQKNEGSGGEMQGNSGSTKAPAVNAEEAGKARERLKAIFDGRPAAKDVQTKIFGVLTDTQKKLVQDALQKQRDELATRAASKKAPAKSNSAPTADPKGEKKSGAAADLKGKSADEIMNDPRVPERLRERLKAMSPEDREKAIKRVRDRIQSGTK